MKNSTSLTIEGMDSLFKNLELTQREARNLNRTVVHAVAGKVRNEARKGAPKDTGKLKKAIVSKRRKSPPDSPVSEVRIEHGPGSKHDAFYWQFVERGTKSVPAQPFMAPAIEAMRPQIKTIYREEFGKKLEALMKRKAKRGAKK